MSPFFVKSFKRQHPCRDCRIRRLTGGPKLGLCRRHLQEAAEQWRCWQEQRRAEQRCISCARRAHVRPSGYVELRCRHHKEVNRVRCLTWSRAHPEHAREQYLKSKALIDSGFCRCSAHTLLRDGFRRCDACRKRGRGRAATSASR